MRRLTDWLKRLGLYPDGKATWGRWLTGLADDIDQAHRNPTDCRDVRLRRARRLMIARRNGDRHEIALELIASARVEFEAASDDVAETLIREAVAIEELPASARNLAVEIVRDIGNRARKQKNFDAALALLQFAVTVSSRWEDSPIPRARAMDLKSTTTVNVDIPTPNF